VFIGKGGVTDGVVDAVRDALDRHELIKVSVPADGSKRRNEMGQLLSTMSGSHVAQTIGRIVLLFRQKGADSQFRLPQKKA
jgi:RNA-binding protein